MVDEFPELDHSVLAIPPPESSNNSVAMLTYASDKEIECGPDVRDRQLVVAARDGDPDAFGVLFETNKNAVYSFVRRSIGNSEDVDDIVQQTFVSAWRAIGGFRGDSRILTWLCKIAANLCKDHLRRRKTKEVTSDGLEESVLLTGQPVCSIEDGYIIRHAVDSALDKLPIEQRMLVVLCDIQGLTGKEAADVVGCSAVSVRVRLCRAHAKLRILLSSALDENGAV